MRYSFASGFGGERGERASFREGGRPSPKRTRAAQWFFLGGLMLLAVGCSGGGGPTAPSISPRGAAGEALALYDTNKDGALDAKELEQCPALKSALKRIDKNNDGRLTADEIADRLAFFQRGGKLTTVVAEVSLDSRPLAGATVTLVPEKFLGPSFKPASGVTDPAGSVVLKVEGSNDDLIPSGYYRIEVSKKNAKGQESIPAKYNAKTILGQEVAPDTEGRGGGGVSLMLRLTSK